MGVRQWADLLLCSLTGLLVWPTLASAAPPARYAQLPVAFEENRGQADPEIRFIARGRGYAVFLTESEAVLVLRSPPRPRPIDVDDEGTAATIRLRLVGATAAPSTIGLDELPGRVSYFVGKNPTRWRTGIATYARVRRADVYPGIDLVYYGDHGHLRFDFVVAPGADPAAIRLSFAGAREIALDPDGDVVIRTAAGEVRQKRPVVYQTAGTAKRPIDGRYVMTDDREVGFVVGEYDPARPLVIDPTLEYGTYLGGSGGDDRGHAITVDDAGNAYVAGRTGSFDFPTASPAFPTRRGVYDAFVTRLDASGTFPVWSTFLGGSGDDSARAIARDAQGNVYVIGDTTSQDFPTTAGAFREFGANDAFVAKLGPDGRLVYATYLGATPGIGYGIAVDGQGRAYVAGSTTGTNFPTTPDAFQTASGGDMDAFVARLNTNGSALEYATYLGGTARDEALAIVIDGDGNAYVTGDTASSSFPTTPTAFQPTKPVDRTDTEAFVTKLNPTGSDLVYSTYLGGTSFDAGLGIALDSQRRAWVTGVTFSSDFPTTPDAAQPVFGGGATDAFVTALKVSGSGLAYSTFLGGSGATDVAGAIALDTADNVWVTGSTESPNFPTVSPILATLRGANDAVVARYTPTGALAFSTYLGGSLDENITDSDAGVGIAVDPAGAAYVTGSTRSLDFPVTDGAFQTAKAGGFVLADAFVVKIVAAATALPSLSIDDVTVVEPSTGTRNAIFTVTLSPASTSTVTVEFATANGTATRGSDYAAESGTLTFAPGETSRPITVTVNADSATESDETFFVDLRNPTSATIARGRGTGTIRDAPLPSLSIDDLTVVEPGTGTRNAIFTVTLSAASASTVMVDFATTNGTATAGSDYAAVSGTVTFAPGETSRPITVTVNSDSATESDETFFVDLRNPTNATIARGRGTGTIRDLHSTVPIDVRETIGVADAVRLLLPAEVAVREVIGVGDVPAVIPPAEIRVTEAVGVADRPAAIPPAEIRVAEAIGVGDAPRAIPPATIAVAERLGVADAPRAIPPVGIAVTETLGVRDAPRAIPPVAIAVSETLRVGDAPRAIPPVAIDVAETIRLGDTPRASPPTAITVSETITFDDSPRASPPVAIDVAETLRLGDAPETATPSASLTSAR